MKTCEYAGAPFSVPRSHPWSDTPSSGARYFDLTATPERIRTSLEDFKPWAHYPAIETFYKLLERINHKSSALDSNDCAFEGPHRNENRAIAKALECSGRVMVLFRALARNTERGQVSWLKNELHAALAPLDPNFQSGIVGTTIIPVCYLPLPEPNGQQLGQQLMISFWAWGNSEPENMQNLARLFKNLTTALRKVSALSELRTNAKPFKRSRR
jgi:hypothetical protein